jgi:TrmH family RNA methyltransferase
MPANLKAPGAVRSSASRRLPPAEKITSAENRWLKRFRAALRSSGPTEDGWVSVEGLHLVKEGLEAGVEVAAVLVSASGERYLAGLDSSLKRVTSSAVRFLRTSDRLFSGISGTETPQGIAALICPRASSFDDILRGMPLVVVLVAVQDPGNVGTALRSAEAFGASGAITTRGTAYPWSPKALRSSAASALRLPILAGMAPAVVLAQLRVSGVKLIAASAETSAGSAIISPAEADFRSPCAILIGNEGAGLPPEVERAADARVRIPIASPVDSLNAAVAASVLLYEAARQRSGQN